MAKGQVLVVDDEVANVELLEEYLDDSGYEVTSAYDGESALSMMLAADDNFDVVLLDRMMPGMDGVDVLRAMKKERRLSGVPVVLQTAKVGEEHVLEGLQAGAHYYLTKPFSHGQVMAIVDTAARQSAHSKAIQAELERMSDTLCAMSFGRFEVRTIEDCIGLAAVLGSMCPNANDAAVGISELLFNGVEHGNLGLNYDDKSAGLRDGNWSHEVTRRLALPEYRDKRVRVEVERCAGQLRLLIVDEGEGFDWREFEEFDPARLLDEHGRGIMMARAMTFRELNYRGCGNEVEAVIDL